LSVLSRLNSQILAQQLDTESCNPQEFGAGWGTHHLCTKQAPSKPCHFYSFGKPFVPNLWPGMKHIGCLPAWCSAVQQLVQAADCCMQCLPEDSDTSTQWWITAWPGKLHHRHVKVLMTIDCLCCTMLLLLQVSSPTTPLAKPWPILGAAQGLQPILLSSTTPRSILASPSTTLQQTRRWHPRKAAPPASGSRRLFPPCASSCATTA
jgi:hypothetical protein